MTEADALKRWCPFAKAAEENHGTYNRTSGQFEPETNAKGEHLFIDKNGNKGAVIELLQAWVVDGNKASDLGPLTRAGKHLPSAADPSCLCLGSGCMAWRKATPIDEEPSGYCMLILHSVKP